MNVRPRIRSARNTRTDSITDAIYKCTTAFGKFYGSQRIGCLPALRNGNHHITTVNHRVPVTKFRSILHFHRNAAETLYQMFAYKRSVPRRATSHNYKTFGSKQTFLIIYNGGKHHVSTLQINASAHTVMNTIGLLKNLLQHEMRITALLQLAEIERHRLYLVRALHILEIHHFQFLPTTNNGYLLIFQIDHLVRIFHNRRGIGCQEEFILPDTHHQRTAFARSNNLIRILPVEHGNGICTDNLLQSQLHGSQ